MRFELATSAPFPRAEVALFSSIIVPATAEQKALRESAAALVGKYGWPYFIDCARKHIEPRELWAQLGDAGFLGVHLDEKFGGGGGGLADMSIIIEEAAAGGCPLLMLVVTPTICGTILDRHGSDELKERWLPGINSGEIKMAFAITEPDAGSNTHQISTKVRREGAGWRLTGGKYWTSGVDEADAILVVARDGDADPAGRAPLSLFVVPTDSAGLTYHPIESALVQPEHQFSVFFDDVALGPQALIGESGQGLRQVFTGLNPERVAAASISNGISLYALEKASAYARERSVWGQPIGAHQGLAHPLAEAYAQVQLARLMTARAAELFDHGQDAAEAANIAKLCAADASLRALDQAIQTHGGNGFALEYGLSELWFLARMMKTAPVSREMVLNFLSRHSLSLPPSY